MDIGLRNIFANNLKSIRRNSGLTQSELSEECGVSCEWLSRMERAIASPSFDVIEDIAVTLNIEPWELFVRKNEELSISVLRQLNHRIKNNYQILASLAGLARSRTESRKDAEMFALIGERVSGMAQTHDMLTGLSRKEVDFGIFARELYYVLADLYESQGVRPVFDLETFRLPVQQAHYLGLALYELLTNVFKHAFLGESGGEVRISLKKENGQVALLVADKGPGASNGRTPKTLPGVGHALVKELAESDLGGSFSFELGEGATAMISFPSP